MHQSSSTLPQNSRVRVTPSLSLGSLPEQQGNNFPFTQAILKQIQVDTCAQHDANEQGWNEMGAQEAVKNVWSTEPSETEMGLF